MERRCWVNFQCRGVLLVWMIVGQGPIALAVGAGGGCLDIFSLIYRFCFLSPSLWETARYRLKYCLKGPLNPKQPTNQLSFFPRDVLDEIWNLMGRFLKVFLPTLSTSEKARIRSRKLCSIDTAAEGIATSLHYILKRINVCPVQIAS